AFFLQSKVAFSLWFLFIVTQLIHTTLRGMGTDGVSEGMRSDHMLGSLIAFTLTILYVGRYQWMLVIRQMLRGERPDEQGGRYMSYPVAGWGLVAASVGMIVWLMAAGMTLLTAVL